MTRALSVARVTCYPRIAVDGVRRIGLAALCAWTLGVAADARADGPFEGQWRDGPMSIQVSVTSWGGDCGPRPQSTTAPGGGTFRISQEGDQLTFHMRQQRTTRGCWSENRAVRRVSSTHQAGTWRIVCRTPPEDSRGETGTYTIQAIGNDQLSFRDVSAYDWQLNESRCVATITTTQSFTRISGGPPPTPPPSTPEPQPSCTPGAAARVVLRPASAEIAPGAEQCFTTRVVDAQGCAVRSQRVELSLASGGGRLEGRCYTAPGAEAQATVVARAGGLSSEARVTVRSMDLSDLIARRSETGSVGSGAASDEDASARTAARVTTRETAEEIDPLWPALALGVALLLVLGGGVALVRRRRPPRRTIAGLPGVEVPEPELRRPARPEPPAPAPAEAAAPPSELPREDMICPSCRRGYPPGTDRCAADGAALVPYREFASAKGRENVCPACGERYPASVRFCGKDGTTLEPG